MNGLKAIETEYKGYRFRSRLEARWAVFFDACGVSWEYEPEGYDLGNGLYYLPDFLLHGVTINHAYHAKGRDLYVEVKGQMTDRDAAKINRFAELRLRDDGESGDLGEKLLHLDFLQILDLLPLYHQLFLKHLIFQEKLLKAQLLMMNFCYYY